MGMDSRSTLRYPIDLAATMTIGTSEVSCRVRNISLGGVFVHGPVLPIGARVKLVFGGGTLERIESTCTSRWGTSEGTGLQFDGLRAVETYALSKFIRACARLSGRIPTDAILRPEDPAASR